MLSFGLERQQEITIIYRKLYEDYALDRIEVETYNEMINSYEKEIKELKRQLININNEEKTKEKRKRDLEEFINRVTDYGVVEILTEEILHDLVDKIIIKEDRNIVIYFKNVGIINM
ncbi:DUF4368 domain-containing protein [Acholeplasma sp. OttesenSCG-928-E16]|nr:DUF4368 domain-containing protein [Acholeplasma sp. OttesenSCG-928-E16]